MTTRTHIPAYEEAMRFLTSSPSLEEIVDFAHSPFTERRVGYLIGRKRHGALSEREREEFAEFIRADNLLRNLKLRARRRLQRLYADD
jgi:hypothetical protein